MRRLLFAVVAVGVLFNAGLSIAQEKAAPQMPEKVRAFLDNLTGTWNIDGTSKGECELAWDTGKGAVIGRGQYQMGDVSAPWTALWYWDGISEDGVILCFNMSNSPGYHQGNLHGQVLSKTSLEGQVTAVRVGKKTEENIQLNFKNPDQFTFTWRATNENIGGEKQPIVRNVYTRVKTTSDEQELIRLNNVWLDAMLKGDAAPLGRILADDYTLGGYDGTVFTKPQYLALMKSGDYVVASIKNDGTKVRIYGETAVTTTLWTEKSQDKGTNMSGQYRSTETWLKRDGQWQCIATHESKIAKTTSHDQKAATAYPSPEMKKLEGLVGNWTYEGEQADTTAAGLPFGPAGKITGRETNRFILGGRFLECKYEDLEVAPASLSGIFTTGYNAKAKHYTDDEYCSDGSRTLGIATLEGCVWTSNGTVSTETGEKVLTKKVVKYSSNWSSYALTTEASADNGKTWSLFYTLKGKKISK